MPETGQPRKYSVLTTREMEAVNALTPVQNIDRIYREHDEKRQDILEQLQFDQGKYKELKPVLETLSAEDQLKMILEKVIQAGGVEFDKQHSPGEAFKDTHLDTSSLGFSPYAAEWLQALVEHIEAFFKAPVIKDRFGAEQGSELDWRNPDTRRGFKNLLKDIFGERNIFEVLDRNKLRGNGLSPIMTDLSMFLNTLNNQDKERIEQHDSLVQVLKKMLNINEMIGEVTAEIPGKGVREIDKMSPEQRLQFITHFEQECVDLIILIKAA